MASTSAPTAQQVQQAAAQAGLSKMCCGSVKTQWAVRLMVHHFTTVSKNRGLTPHHTGDSCPIIGE